MLKIKNLKKIMIYLGTFWYGWILVYRVKRSKLPVTDYLDRHYRRKRQRSGLEAEEICRLISKASSSFWFHKQQICLAQSLAAYYYLKIYGYRPYFLMEIDFQCGKYYNCHSWVCLDRDLQKGYLKNLNVLNIHNNSILVEKSHEQRGDRDGEYPSDKLLQPELPLLFCWDGDGSKKQ